MHRRSRSSRFAVPALVALSFALLLPLASQEPPREVTVIGESIDVRVVNVEAVVTDRSGKRVHGLKASDFRLRIDGKEVPTEYFSEIEDGRALAGTPGAPVEVGTGVERSYLVYIDDSYSLVPQRNAVLDRLEASLTVLGPVDRMAVMAFDGEKLEILCAWTGDRAALRAAIARARERPSRGVRTLAAQRALGRDVTYLQDNANSIQTGDSETRVGGPKVHEMDQLLYYLSLRTSPEARTQSGKTVDSLAATLRGFEAPPGRKVMFALTGAWQLSVAPELYGPILQAATSQGYSIYPVDTAKSDATEVTAFDHLARYTGGRAIVAADNDAFRQVVADSGSYYWLGFSPPGKATDGMHRIEVEVTRPGLQVRSRRSFADRSPRSEVVQKAESLLLFGGNPEDRKLIVELGTPKPKGQDGKELEVPVTFGVPVEALALRPDDKGGYRAKVPIAVAGEDAQHRRAALPKIHLEVSTKVVPPLGTLARFKAVLQVRNADQRLVFTVQDPENGKPIWGEAELKPASGEASEGN